ncbi:MAG: nucleotidyl transferase AbiEii/AbiGii toxin family protein [Desulfobacteraceae bacterium]|nr:nucleotidyl transferase AbiEii/AbiGii toxin family protein [Desulfobacteraceae bacterium]
MNGFSDEFSDQIGALNDVYIHALSKIPLEAWSFGGGTALALFHFQHRKSYDIDIFVNDPQYFAFLSPKWLIEDSDCFQADYTELAHHISLTTKNGIKTDFLLVPQLTDQKSALKKIGNIECYVESAYEIIAKKIRFRFRDMRTRDIADIAVAVENIPDILINLWENKVISLDEFFEWGTALKKLDRQRYVSQIQIIALSAEYSGLLYDGPQRIIHHIEQAKKKIQNCMK